MGVFSARAASGFIGETDLAISHHVGARLKTGFKVLKLKGCPDGREQ
jgi:hypothetical protein